MGLRALRRIQIGKEGSTPDKMGVAAPATAALLGTLTMKESPTIHRPVEERGVLAEFSRSVKVANLAELVFEGDVTFEQILYWLHMGVLGDISPSGEGVWTFTPAMDEPGVFDSFTIEYGDDIAQWYTEFCLARTIEISGAMNEPMRVRANIFGRKMTPLSGGFTEPGGNPIIPPAVESVLTQMAALYIEDDADAIIGTSPVASTLISFNYVITTGLAPKRFADGSIDFSTYNETFKGVTLRMTFAFNADAEAEHQKADAETIRLVRIEAEGINGKKLTLDACGIWLPDRWETLAERDGEDIVDVTLAPQMGLLYPKLFEVAVKNDEGSLP